MIKNKRLLFSRTIGCFLYCFLIVMESKNSQTGYRNTIFFPNGLWRFLKNGHLPVKLHSSAPPPPPSGQDNSFRVRPASVKSGQKGPVKLIKRVKIAHSFLQSVKSVPRYHFKLTYVILQMAVKKCSKSTSKNEDIGHLESFLTNLAKSTAVYR